MKSMILAVAVPLLLVAACTSTPSAAPSPSATAPPAGPSTESTAPTPTPTPTPTTFDIDGILRVLVTEFEGEEGDDCASTTPYDDIETGAEVKVIAGGEVIATGEIGSGEVSGSLDGYAQLCDFLISVSEVPDGFDSYRVSVPYSSEEYSRDRLAEPLLVRVGH